MSVTRVKEVSDLPTVSLRCAAAGRHLGFFDDPTVSPESVGGWGSRDARQVISRCDCERTKVEVIDWNSGETLTRTAAYDGGTLPETPTTPHEARLVLLRRIVAAARAAQDAEDARIIAEAKDAATEHKATRNGRRRRPTTAKGT